jgi:hypothetical protein
MARVLPEQSIIDIAEDDSLMRVLYEFRIRIGRSFRAAGICVAGPAASWSSCSPRVRTDVASDH